VTLKKKLFALFPIVLFLTQQHTAIAQRISAHEARIAGDNFLVAKASHGVGIVDSRRPSLSVLNPDAEIGAMSPILNHETGDTLAHLVRIKPTGYVVLSNDKRITPIIAYSFVTDFDTVSSQENDLLGMIVEDMRLRNEALRMNVYPGQQIQRNIATWEALSSLTGAQALEEGANQAWPDFVYGWVNTHWGQSAPYNLLCPIDPTTDQRCLTGCVATAMGQIVNYWGTTTGSPVDVTLTGSYTTIKRRIVVDRATASFSGMVYPVQDIGIAQLLFACGAALSMDYTSSSSGSQTWKVAQVLHWTFGYASARTTSAGSDFYATLRDNLKNGMPAQLGIGSENGHSIVCDGYQTESGSDLYHLNYGWDGMYENWYSLPEGMPAGYSVISEAVVDIEGHVYPPVVNVPHLMREQWNEISFTFTAPTTGNYYVKAFSKDQSLPLTWEWASDSTLHQVLTAGSQGVFTLAVRPTTSSEDCQFWVYRESWIPGSFATMGRSLYTLFATDATAESLTIIVQNAEGAGPLRSTGQVSLYDSTGGILEAQNTDSGGVATFTNVVPGSGYSYSVRDTLATMFGRTTYWGMRSGLVIPPDSSVQETFYRNMPYASSLKVYNIDNGQDITGKFCQEGTPVRAELMLKNPNGAGSTSHLIGGRVVLNTNSHTPYAFDSTIAAIHPSLPGTTTALEYIVVPRDTGAYYSAVTATTVVGESTETTDATNWSSVLFTVAAMPPSPELRWPPRGAVGMPPFLTLEWDSLVLAASYRVQISLDSVFTNCVVDDSNLTSRSVSVGQLRFNAVYYWRVRGQNAGGGGAYSPTWWFRTTLASPTPLSPQNGAMQTFPITRFVWSSVAGATRYSLQHSTDSIFAGCVDTTLADTSYSGPTPFVGVQKYYWRVRASNSEAQGGWTARWMFTILPEVPGVVALLSPLNAALLSCDSVVMMWRRSGPEVERYWCEIATDSAFTFGVADSLVLDTSKVARSLVNAQTYWWKVRAHNAAGWGPLSETRVFQVAISNVSAQDEIPSEYGMSQNYPNPFNPSTTIRYGLPQRSDVNLVVYNMLGQTVLVLVREAQPAGYHEVTLDASGMSSGVYLCRIQAGTFVATRRLLLIK
jgi:hypothetical protein